MAGHGYSGVNDKGYGAFGAELKKSAWGGVSIKKYDSQDGNAQLALADAPMVVAWKLRATWGIRTLVQATGTDALVAFDDEWDSAQRAFNLRVGAAEEHQKPAVRQAATRVRASLLSGAGTAQTSLTYDQEVDFGRNQAELAGKAPLAADLETIGAGDALKRIHLATEALAGGLGRGANKGRAPARSQRVREALMACSTAFNGIHDEIVWALDHTRDQAERTRLEALLAPMQALLDRYPSAAATPAAPAAPAPGGGVPTP